jgi:hypothetical protein
MVAGFDPTNMRATPREFSSRLASLLQRSPGFSTMSRMMAGF